MELTTLPPAKDKEAVAKALESARLAAWTSRNSYLVWCQISFYYLKGFRRFRVNSLADARVLVGYEDDIGNLNFRNEDLREKYKTALGRFLRMDLSPVISKRSWGLDSIRKASISQVALDHEMRFTDLKELQGYFIQLYLLYGTVGLGHWTYKDHEGNDQNEIEIIPPWELLPIPAFPTTPQQLRGLLRYRKVPLKWLQKYGGLEGTKSKSGNTKSEYEIERVPYGSTPSHGVGDMAGAQGFSGFIKGSRKAELGGNTGDEATEEFVPLLETWITGPDKTVARYIKKVGKVIIEDIDFLQKQKKVPMPISMARYVPDSSFYSYGFVTMLMSGNHQEEKMLQNLFRNVEELDQYGTLFWPLTAGAGKNEFNKKNGRPKIVSYEPDYTVPDAKPFSITPVNTGDFPGRIAQLASARQDKLSGQGPMFQGQSVGRMDSAPGLGFTFEVSQIAQAASAHQIADTWAQIYRSLLYSIKESWDESGSKILTVTNIDDNVAGIKIKDDGTVDIEKNPIPDYWEVKIDVTDREPKSRDARKQELLAMLERGIIDETEFRIINWKEDLDFPVGNRAEFEAHRKAIFHNIVLFGDGETPGEINPDIFMDNPEIHLRALTAFVARLEMTFASKEVRSVFTKYIILLQNMMGTYPNQLPRMEDLAEGMLGGTGGPGGPGGPGAPAGGPPPSGGGQATPGGSPMEMMAGLPGI